MKKKLKLVIGAFVFTLFLIAAGVGQGDGGGDLKSVSIPPSDRAKTGFSDN